MSLYLKNSNILVIGDIMLDEYWFGNTYRISPEAPVPIVSVERAKYVLGGAGNVVNNLAGLGTNVFVAGLIGNDSIGKSILKLLIDFGVDINSVIKDSSRISTIKTRVIAQTQQMIRIDREKIKPIDKRNLMLILESIETYRNNFDSIIISDYGKGVVTPELVSVIVDNFDDKFIVVDPGGKTIDDYTKYRGVDVLTPNKQEASLASGIDIVNNETMRQAANKIFNQTNAKSLLITCGEDGMVLFDGKEMVHICSKAIEVYDVSGAGDTVIATFTTAYSCGFSLKDSAHIANVAAGVVVGKLGTSPITIEELRPAL